MELRHLENCHRTQLSRILDNNESWKSLMEKIPRDLADIKQENISRKYSAEQIKQIDETSKQDGRSPTDILLDEWGTSGRTRATVDDLLELLKKVQLYHAADFVAIQILKIQPPQGSFGASLINTTITFDARAFGEMLKYGNNLIDWSYSSLPSDFDSYSKVSCDSLCDRHTFESIQKNNEQVHSIRQTINTISSDGHIPSLSILNGFIYDII